MNKKDFIGDNQDLSPEEKKAILSGNAEKLGFGVRRALQSGATPGFPSSRRLSVL